MKVREYLEAVLRDQTLASNSEELTKLQDERQKVEALLRSEFEDSPPEIRYGGSMAKKTMIKAAYDLDLTCYFSHDESGAGETLKEIYDNVKAALESAYFTEPKTSAIRLRASVDRTDFHIDVVPGRFVEDREGDVFIYQSATEKDRLKTNLDVHIKHIRDSGVTDTVRLIKLWRERNRLLVKTFVLELLVVDLLRNKRTISLEDQLKHVWIEFRNNADSLTVETLQIPPAMTSQGT
jgi:tRNA nucleotidyltransferase (CCA-adding enzyme)